MFISASVFVCSSVLVCLFISAGMFVHEYWYVYVHQCQYVFISVGMFVCSLVSVCLCVHQCRYVCRLDRNRLWTVSPGPQRQPSQPGVTAGVERIHTICSVCPGSVTPFLSAPPPCFIQLPFFFVLSCYFPPSLSFFFYLSLSLLHPKQLKISTTAFTM